MRIHNVKNFEPTCSNAALFSHGAIACDGIYHFSDTRIKKDVLDIGDAEALEKVRLLKPKTYSYKNSLQKGDARVIGFIAQDVKEIIPEAVSFESHIIPNIYSNAVAHTVQKTDTLTLSPEEYKNHPHPGVKEMYTFDASSNLYTKELVYTFSNVITFDTTQLLDNNSNLVIVNHVTGKGFVYNIERIDGNVVTLNTSISNMAKNGNVFVYGQPVDDFHVLKKDYLWGISVAAIQEMDRKQQQLEARIAALENASHS